MLKPFLKESLSQGDIVPNSTNLVNVHFPLVVDSIRL